MDTGTFGLGVAARNSKPTNKIEQSKAKEEEIARMEADDLDERDDLTGGVEDEDESKMEIIRLKKQRNKKRAPIDRQSAFIEYKALPEGKQFEDQIIHCRQELKEKKLVVKALTDTCNVNKRDLDVIKQKLDAKAEEKKEQMREDLAGLDDDDGGVGNQQEIIDEEELGYLQKMKELKKSYRENYEQLKSIKGEVFFIQQSVNS